MGMQRGVGYSQDADSRRAGRRIAELALEAMAGRTPDILLLFATVGHDIPTLLSGIREVVGDVPLVGCSGAGIFSGLGADEATHSAALLGVAAPRIRFSPFLVEGLSRDPEAVGRDIGRRVAAEKIPEDAPHFVMLLPDGLTVNGDRLLAGIEAGAGRHVDCVGGTAGNDYRFSETLQFGEGRATRDAVAGLVVSGALNYEIGVSHGSEAVGLFRTATRARRNVVYEIDGRPAVELLRTFLGEERLSDLGQVINLFELGEAFEERGYSGDIINRAIIGLDPEAGSITLGAEVAEGAKIRLTRRDPDRVLAGTRSVAAQVMDGLDRPDEAALIYFNCSGRGAYLFGDSDPDVDILASALGPAAAPIGFFCFGEIAPVAGQNHFHNYTGVLLGFEERDG
ncbi:MAG: FIST signal transduction protein [Thermodesulfobacteriota bacterium]